jgi:hypothetical protein
MINRPRCLMERPRFTAIVKQGELKAARQRYLFAGLGNQLREASRAAAGRKIPRCRQTEGGTPIIFLNARLKAASDS